MRQHAQLPPILTAHLFPKIEELLVTLLRSLKADQWERQTMSPKWKVKDVAAHLLDTQLRKLSIARDGYLPPGPPITDLVAFVDRLNQEGVMLYRRLSPPVLISLMEWASRESAEYHLSLDPFSPAPFAVSWAGEEISLNWFDTAREYTGDGIISSRFASRSTGPASRHGSCIIRCSIAFCGRCPTHTGTRQRRRELFSNLKSAEIAVAPGGSTVMAIRGAWWNRPWGR